MDKYEQMMHQMMQMSEAEKMAMIEDLKKLCICSSCPSYKGTGEKALLFCSMGKSSIITEEKGCTCPGCPVTPKMGLKNQYFCTRGSEREIRGMTM